MRSFVLLVITLFVSVNLATADAKFGTSRKLEMRKNGAASTEIDATNAATEARARINIESDITQADKSNTAPSFGTNKKLKLRENNLKKESDSNAADLSDSRARIDNKALANTNLDAQTSESAASATSKEDHKFGTNKKLERRLNTH